MQPNLKLFPGAVSQFVKIWKTKPNRDHLSIQNFPLPQNHFSPPELGPGSFSEISEIVSARKYSNWNPIRAFQNTLLGKVTTGFTLPAFVFAFILPLGESFAQSTPQLNSTKTFSSGDLQPYVDSAMQGADESSFMNTLNAGEQVLEADWEAAVDAEIESIVNQVTTSDPVNDVSVYQQAVRAQLELQKQQAKSQWMADATAYIQTELQAFLNLLSAQKQSDVSSSSQTSLSTIDPTVQNTTAAIATQEVSPAQAAQSYYQGAQLWDSKWQDLLDKQSSWENSSLSSIQNGLDQWDNSILRAEQEKSDFLAALDQQEALWQNNGTMISNAEQSTRDYLASLVDSISLSMKTSIGSDTASNAALGTAFAQAQGLVSQVQSLLASNSPLDQIALTLGQFFQSQQTFAEERAAYWNDPAQREQHYTGYQSVDFNYYVGGYSATGSQKDWTFANQITYTEPANWATVINSCKSTGSFQGIDCNAAYSMASGTDVYAYFNKGLMRVSSSHNTSISDSQLQGITFGVDGSLSSVQYVASGGDCVATAVGLTDSTLQNGVKCSASQFAGNSDTTTCNSWAQTGTESIAACGKCSLTYDIPLISCNDYASVARNNISNVTTTYTIDQDKLSQDQYILGALSGTQFAESSGVYGNITNATNKIWLGGVGSTQISSLSDLGTDGAPKTLLVETDYTFDDPQAIANRDEWSSLAGIYSSLSAKLLAMVTPLQDWEEKNTTYQSEYQTKLTELQSLRVAATTAFDNQISDLKQDRDTWATAVYGYEIPGYDGIQDNQYSQFRQGEDNWANTISDFQQTELQWFLASKDTLETALQDPSTGELKFIADGSQAIDTLKTEITTSEQNTSNLYNTTNQLINVYYYKGAADSLNQAIANQTSQATWNQEGADLSASIRDSYGRSEAYGTADLDATNRINQLVESIYGTGSYAYDTNDISQIQTSVSGYSNAQSFWQEEIDGSTDGFGFSKRLADTQTASTDYTALLADTNQAATLQSIVVSQEKNLLNDVNEIFAQEKKYDDLAQKFADKGDFDTAEYYKTQAIKQEKLAQEKLKAGYGDLSQFAGDQVPASTLSYTKTSYIAYGQSLLRKGSMSSEEVALEIRKSQNEAYALSQSGIDYESIQGMISSSQTLLQQGDEQAEKVKALIAQSQELANRSIGGDLLEGLNEVLVSLTSRLPDAVTTDGISDVIAADSAKANEVEDQIGALLSDMNSLLTSPEDLQRLSDLQQSAGAGINLTANTAILNYLDSEAQKMEELNRERSATAFDSLWDKINNGSDYQYLRDLGYSFTKGANGTIVGVREINSGVYKVEGNAMTNPTYTAIFVDQYLSIQTEFSPPAISLNQLSADQLASTGFSANMVSAYMQDIKTQEDNINLAYEQFSDKAEYLKSYSDSNEAERVANEEYYEQSKAGVLVTYNGLQDKFQKDQKVETTAPARKEISTTQLLSNLGSGDNIRVTNGVGQEGQQLQQIALNKTAITAAKETEQETVQQGFDSIMSSFKDNLALSGYKFKTEEEQYKGTWELTGSVTVGGIPFDMTYGKEEITLPTTFHLENIGFDFGFSGVGEQYTGQKLQEVYTAYSDYLNGVIKDVQTVQAQNQADADQKKLLFDVASGMVGGHSVEEAAKGVYQDRVTGAIAEVTGLPASLIGALVGGGSMSDAIKAYQQDVVSNAISEATGIPAWAITGQMTKMNQPKEQWYQSETFQMVTAVAAVAAAPFTGGASLYAAAAIGAATGAAQGGLQGAVVGAIGGVAQAYTKEFGVNVNLSYSYSDGFGATLGVGYGGFGVNVGISEYGGTSVSGGVQYNGFNAGLNYNSKTGDLSGNVGYQGANGSNLALSYSQQSGVGVNAGLNSNKYGVGGNVGWSQNDGFGGGVSYGVPGEGKWAGTGANINWTEYGGTTANLTAAGGLGGMNNTSTYGSGGVTAGTWSSETGFAANTNFLNDKFMQDVLQEGDKRRVDAEVADAKKAAQDQANDAKQQGAQNAEGTAYEVARREEGNILDDAIDWVGEKIAGGDDGDITVITGVERYVTPISGSGMATSDETPTVTNASGGRSLNSNEKQVLLDEMSKQGANKVNTEKMAAIFESHGVSQAEIRKIVDEFRTQKGSNSTKFSDTEKMEIYQYRNELGLDGGNVPEFLHSGYYDDVKPRDTNSESLSRKDGNKKRDFQGGEIIKHDKGLDEDAPHWTSKKTGKEVFAYDNDSVVKIVGDNNTNGSAPNWEKVKFTGDHSRKNSAGKEVGQPHRADINTYDTWNGPNAPFTVEKAYVRPGWGGTVEIRLNDGTQVRMLHFTELNKDIFNAQGTGKVFNPNTFIGRTGKIGYSTGSHLHIEAVDGKTSANEILDRMGAR